MDWIIHLDTDELLHPAGAREYSLRRLLLDVPGNVDMVVFPNYVSEFIIGLLELFVMYDQYSFTNCNRANLLEMISLPHLPFCSLKWEKRHKRNNCTNFN